MFHVKHLGRDLRQPLDHAAARRLAATYSADSAAGVTPGTRDAWSSVSGRAAAAARPSRWKDRESPHNPDPLESTPASRAARLPIHAAAERHKAHRVRPPGPRRSRPRGSRAQREMALNLRAPPIGDTVRRQRGLAEPRRRIVRAQRQAIFGARGHHAIRLADALQRQVVDHHPDVGAAPVESHLVERQRSRGGIETGRETLGSGFLVTGRAVDLAGQEQSRQVSNLQRLVEPPRIDELIFDRIAGPDDLGALQAGDRADERLLHVCRKRSRYAVGIDQGIIQPLRLEENLMGVAIGEALHLVLDRGTIARSPPSIAPANSGERSKLARMISWVRSLVRVIAQRNCGCPNAVVERRHRPGSASLGCSSVRAQSIVRPSSRGGVPVLSRP